MNRLPGVPLKGLWGSPALTWEHRKKIARRVMEIKRELEYDHFTVMGGLYLTPGPNVEDIPWLSRSAFPVFLPCPNDPRFVIGPSVHVQWFYDRRLQLSPERGPFLNAAAAPSALVRLEIASASAQKNNIMALSTDDCDPKRIARRITELDRTISAARDLLAELPAYFARIARMATSTMS